MSEGNLRCFDSGDDWTHATATITMPQDKKIYFEVYGDSLHGQYVGIALADENAGAYSNGSRPDGGWMKGLVSLYLDTDTAGYVYRTNTGGTALSRQDFSGSGFFKAIVGVAVDQANQTVDFYVNGSLLNSSDLAVTACLDTTSSYVPIVAGHNNSPVIVNFGQDSSFAGKKTSQGNQDGNDIGDFYYTPPTGFLALCTSNLPDVAVTPSEHFNTVLYSGNDGTNAITGVGFQPDFTWIKARSDSRSHSLVDSVRGFNGSSARVIQSGSTNAEWESSVINSLDSDGFTVSGSDNYINNSSHTYVAWNWKGNSSGTSVSESGTSANSYNACTHYANQDAGFSIIKYTGNNGSLSNGQETRVTHGLGAVPELILIKNRDSASGFVVQQDDQWNDTHLRLDTTDAFNGSLFTGNQESNATSSYFVVGNDDIVNKADDEFIAYVWKSVEGYSKKGEFTGNGNADGTFIYTGFRPAYVLIKRVESAGQGSPIFDSARNEFNVTTKRLNSNATTAEVTTDGNIDLLSNGFKARNTDGSVNTSGGTYIYLAFAETPFKYSNAR
jgi:hypothetical protein